MELPGAPEDEHCPAPIAGENDVIKEVFCAGWRLECGTLELVTYEGSRNLCTTVVGAPRRKKEQFFYISPPSGEAVLQPGARESEAPPCPAKCWVLMCGESPSLSAQQVCGRVLWFRSLHGGSLPSHRIKFLAIGLVAESRLCSLRDVPCTGTREHWCLVSFAKVLVWYVWSDSMN